MEMYPQLQQAVHENSNLEEKSKGDIYLNICHGGRSYFSWFWCSNNELVSEIVKKSKRN